MLDVDSVQIDELSGTSMCRASGRCGFDRKVYGIFSIQELDVRTGLNLLECMWSGVIL